MVAYWMQCLASLQALTLWRRDWYVSLSGHFLASFESCCIVLALPKVAREGHLLERHGMCEILSMATIYWSVSCFELCCGTDGFGCVTASWSRCCEWPQRRPGRGCWIRGKLKLIEACRKIQNGMWLLLRHGCWYSSFALSNASTRTPSQILLLESTVVWVTPSAP